MTKLERYLPIVGENVIAELQSIANKLSGIKVQHINSTAVGGGVAEILMRMVPLLLELGIETRWDVIKGDDRFFAITKNMHNALHGVPIKFTQDDLQFFLEINRKNVSEIELWGDFQFIHDPQPIALIERRTRADRKWIWRCHIDFSQPDRQIWNFLKSYIERYDAAIFSAPAFSRELKTSQVLISPSIDPLSDKNREISAEMISGYLAQFKIDPQRPIVTQISRFDYLKDPLGVIQAYRMVKKYVDCQLVLAGGGATDDPEGAKVLAEVQEAASSDRDIFVLLLPPGSDLEINALQRASTVILQKSLREGFGLTVSEALWKAKPVIAGAVGGIPLQIAHKHSGLLTHTVEGTAFALKQLLQNSEYACMLGENGREHVRRNFLITRHVREYLLLFLALLKPGHDVIFL